MLMYQSKVRVHPNLKLKVIVWLPCVPFALRYIPDDSKSHNIYSFVSSATHDSTLLLTTLTHITAPQFKASTWKNKWKTMSFTYEHFGQTRPKSKQEFSFLILIYKKEKIQTGLYCSNTINPSSFIIHKLQVVRVSISKYMQLEQNIKKKKNKLKQRPMQWGSHIYIS